MIRLLKRLVLIGLISASICSCSKPVDPPASEAGDPYAALDRFAEQLQVTTEVARRADASQLSFGRGDGARQILRLMRRAIDEELASADTRYPFFQIQDEWYARLGMSNPDNLYLVARIDDVGVYRIRGRRGTASDFTIQVYQGYPGSQRPLVAIGSIGLDNLQTDAEGRFDIMLGGPALAQNWIELHPNSGRIVVRYTYGDWNDEFAGELGIERLGSRGVAAAPVDDAEVAARIDAASAYLDDALAGYMGIANWVFSDLSMNSLPPLRRNSGAEGGLTNQYTVTGRYRIREDQALVVTTRPSDARYQGFQLGTDWFEALNFRNQVTSINSTQARLSSDGRYRFIISTRDPGFANWLDASGAPQGQMVLRWQGVSELGPEDEPTIELVDFEALEASFPGGEKRITAAERHQQLAERQSAIERRYSLTHHQ